MRPGKRALVYSRRDDLAVSVLRERNFRYLFAAPAISFFVTNLAPVAVAVAFVVLGLGGSARHLLSRGQEA